MRPTGVAEGKASYQSWVAMSYTVDATSHMVLVRITLYTFIHLMAF